LLNTADTGGIGTADNPSADGVNADDVPTKRGEAGRRGEGKFPGPIVSSVLAWMGRVVPQPRQNALRLQVKRTLDTQDISHKRTVRALTQSYAHRKLGIYS
jgi:hypothetical protein